MHLKMADAAGHYANLQQAFYTQYKKKYMGFYSNVSLHQMDYSSTCMGQLSVGTTTSGCSTAVASKGSLVLYLQASYIILVMGIPSMSLALLLSALSMLLFFHHYYNESTMLIQSSG
jgi:hypothetical protein